MEEPNKIIIDIYEHITKYVRLQAKSAQLEVYERLTILLSSGITSSFVILFAFFSFLFINFGLAYWLSENLHSRSAGFTIVGLFYFIVLGAYLLFRKKIARNKVRDVVLLKVSKTMSDYAAMMAEQEKLHAEVDQLESEIGEAFQELKASFQQDVPEQDIPETEEQADDKALSRMAITHMVDFLFKKVLFKNGGMLKKQVLPMVANTVVTSTLFNESKGKSLLENLKVKFRKLFS